MGLFLILIGLHYPYKVKIAIIFLGLTISNSDENKVFSTTDYSLEPHSHVYFKADVNGTLFLKIIICLRLYQKRKSNLY